MFGVPLKLQQAVEISCVARAFPSELIQLDGWFTVDFISTSDSSPLELSGMFSIPVL